MSAMCASVAFRTSLFKKKFLDTHKNWCKTTTGATWYILIQKDFYQHFYEVFGNLIRFVIFELDKKV
jgi:hypothetical protein